MITVLLQSGSRFRRHCRIDGLCSADPQIVLNAGNGGGAPGAGPVTQLRDPGSEGD